MSEFWPSNPDVSVTIAQVASLYGVSAKTIRRWVKTGKVLQPEHKGRMSWRAGDVLEYRRAWNMVAMNRKAAKSLVAKLGQTLSKSGRLGTSAPEAEKDASQKRKGS